MGVPDSFLYVSNNCMGVSDTFLGVSNTRQVMLREYDEDLSGELEFREFLPFYEVWVCPTLV